MNVQTTTQRRPETPLVDIADESFAMPHSELPTTETAARSSPSAPAPTLNREPPSVAVSETAILFYDGVCGLCSNAVDFVIRRDRTGRIKFAPLQGETAARMLNRKPGDSLNSMILVENHRTSSQSDAACRVLTLLGGGWAIVGGLLWCVPSFARNIGYRLVASNRYRIWGQKESCRMPTPAERNRFLP